MGNDFYSSSNFINNFRFCKMKNKIKKINKNIENLFFV